MNTLPSSFLLRTHVAIFLLARCASAAPPVAHSAPPPVVHSAPPPSGLVSVALQDSAGKHANALRVFLDGSPVSCRVSPCLLHEVAEGPHDVRVDGPQGEVLTQRISVLANAEVRVATVWNPPVPPASPVSQPSAEPSPSPRTPNVLPPERAAPRASVREACDLLRRHAETACKVQQDSMSCRVFSKKAQGCEERDGY